MGTVRTLRYFSSSFFFWGGGVSFLHIKISGCLSYNFWLLFYCLVNQLTNVIPRGWMPYIGINTNVQLDRKKCIVMGGNGSHSDAPPSIMLGDHFETFYLWSAFYTKQVWMDLQFKIHQICRVMILIMWCCQAFLHWYFNTNVLHHL